ncbi:hypothetical protein SAMN05428982_0871 [Pseudoxanthomonas sp. CF385]|nr:hypothetical protein SAMN05428982_0871 [Pseudoxanthomonas sp. CF385]
MHRMTRVAVSAALLTVLAACGERHPDAEATPTAAGVAPPATAAQEAAPEAAPVELLPAGGAAEAFPLVAGSYASGRIVLKDATPIKGALVQIGNYNGTTDGELVVEVCKQQDCTKGSKPLTGSVDNEYIEVTLAAPLEVAAQEAITYRISKMGGSVPVALWLYPVAGELSAIRINDGEEVQSTPKIALRR